MSLPPSARRALRETLIARRLAMTAAARAEATAAIVTHLSALLGTLDASTLGFCWPYRGEPDLTRFVSDWLRSASERRAALPVVVAPDLPLQFARWWPEAEMVADSYGIPVPSEREWVMPDVLLVPVVGFDTRGFRLGYGGGYFDRTLAALSPRPATIGVGFECARIEAFAPAPHDEPLDWMVSEAGCLASPHNHRNPGAHGSLSAD